MNNKLNKEWIVIVCHEATMAGGANRSLIDWLSDASESEYLYYVIIPDEGARCASLEKSLDNLRIKHCRAKYLRETYIRQSNTGVLQRAKSMASKAVRAVFVRFLEGAVVNSAAESLKNLNVAAVLSNSISTCFGYRLAEKLQVAHVWHVREELKSMRLEYPQGFRLEEAAENSSAIYISEAVQNDYKNRLNFLSEKVIHDKIVFGNPERSRDNTWLCKEKECRAMSVGALTDRKRHHIAIEAIHALKSSGVRVHLDIYGDGPEREALKRQVKELGCEDLVSLKGYEVDINNKRTSYDISITASENESLGRISLEAMYYGNLLIASNSGFNPYLIGDNERGILFELDNVDQLSDSIVWAIDNGAAVKSILSRARTYAATFQDPIVGSIEDFLKSVIKLYRNLNRI